MTKPKNTRTYSREDRNVSLAPLDFDEAVTGLLSVPPPKEPKQAKAQDKTKPRKPGSAK